MLRRSGQVTELFFTCVRGNETHRTIGLRKNIDRNGTYARRVRLNFKRAADDLIRLWSTGEDWGPIDERGTDVDGKSLSHLKTELIRSN